LDRWLAHFRATVSAVSCLVVPAFICIDLLFSFTLKLNDDDLAESALAKVRKGKGTV